LTIDRVCRASSVPCAALLRALLQWCPNTPVAGQGRALPRRLQAVGDIVPRPILGGLHHHYVRT
jgi:hypothetical protein